MPLVLSAGAILLLVLVVAMLNSQSGGDEGGEAQDPPEQRQPAAPSRSAPQATQLKMGTATSGKTPDRPAPTLTNEMLQKANAMIDEVKALNNEGTRLRNAGDNRAARAKQSEAKRKIDEVKALLEAPSAWQEEADLGGWAMPAEYVTLANLYVRIAKYQKRIRMAGGK